MTEEMKDFLRKYQDLTEKMGNLIGDWAERFEITDKDTEIIKSIFTDLKSLQYYARKHDEKYCK